MAEAWSGVIYVQMCIRKVGARNKTTWQIISSLTYFDDAMAMMAMITVCLNTKQNALNCL